MPKAFTKILSATLCLMLFCTNCLLAHVQETNLWDERRKTMQSAELRLQNPKAPLQLASLVSAGLPISAIHSLTTDHFPTIPNSVSHSALQKYGSIRKIIRPANKKEGQVVIHIQDVHMNPEAQKNIGAAVQALIKDSNVNMVALEGGFGPVGLGPFQRFPRRDTVRKVVNYLLRQNKISGPIHALMTAEGPSLIIVGVDDREHYIANVKAYQQAVKRQKEIKARLVTIKAELVEQKAKVFNKELKKFDALVESYAQKKISMGEYLSVIASEAMTNTHLLLEALHLESSLNFAQVEAERAALLSQLAPRLKKQEMEDLLAMSTAYKMGQINHADFYEYLKKLCEKHRVDLAKFPSMNSYMKYVLLAESIDSDSLLHEMRSLEEKTYVALAKSDEEKKLVAESKHLRLTEKLVDFSMTKEEEWNDCKELQAVGSKLLASEEHLINKALPEF